MTSINATNARKNLYQLITNVNDNAAPITITNNKGKNAVLVGEEDWNAIQETLYLSSIPGYVESVKKVDMEDVNSMETYDPEEEW